mgnify:CR=1 FL=1
MTMNRELAKNDIVFGRKDFIDIIKHAVAIISYYSLGYDAGKRAVKDFLYKTMHKIEKNNNIYFDRENFLRILKEESEGELSMLYDAVSEMLEELERKNENNNTFKP